MLFSQMDHKLRWDEAVTKNKKSLIDSQLQSRSYPHLVTHSLVLINHLWSYTEAENIALCTSACKVHFSGPTLRLHKWHQIDPGLRGSFKINNVSKRA